ncbi:hypothetical protein ATCC90586_002791 [Pythium insidiosum]|nr:hypothetical protein ATCC90586_002791 [Pythium insidiosum]
MAPRTRDGESAARHAYEHLQFDFPIVDDAALLALAQQYRRLATATTRDPTAATWAISTTMVDGFEYLTGSASSSTAAAMPRGSEASGLLAAAVLLLLPRRLLHDDLQVTSPVSDLLRRLQPPRPSVEPQSPPLDPIQQLQNAHDAENIDRSELLVELLAAEEDPDDLSLVYEADEWNFDSVRRAPIAEQAVGAVTDVSHREVLRFLASKTFPSLINSISLEQWTDWALDDTLASIIQSLLSAKIDGDDAKSPLCGPQGEWQRYLFLWRDHLLRLRTSASSLTSSLDKLWALAQWIHSTNAAMDDDSYSTPPLRVVLRVVAELTQSQAFSHDLARGIQTLHPLLLHELELLAHSYRKDKATAFASHHGDHVLVLIQLLRFELRLATTAAADRLQASGLLRAALTLLPTTEDDHEIRDAVWLAPLLRLLAESAMWSAVVATFVLRVPRMRSLWERLNTDETWAVERCLLTLAARQHRVDVASAVVELLPVEKLFPSQCLSFVDAMHQMADAMYLVDTVGTAWPSLRSQLQDEFSSSLRHVYSTRFLTAFEYPTFQRPPSTETAREPEPPLSPNTKESVTSLDHDEPPRGQAEAQRFIEQRNRLRRSIKAVLLASSSGATSSLSSVYANSSKLD